MAGEKEDVLQSIERIAGETINEYLPQTPKGDVKILASKIALNFNLEWDGCEVYIGKYSQVKADNILREFNGTNHKELATRFRVTERTVYNIIKQDKKNKQSKQSNMLDYL